MKPIKVGLLGMGTVGSGVFTVLKRNQEEIFRRAGRGIEIAMVADLDTARAQAAAGAGVTVVDDARKVIANPEIDIVIELIGGYGIAKAAGAGSDRGRQTRGHRQQGAAGRARHRDFCGGAPQGRDGGVRSGGGRRHSHHQGAARRPDRQPHPVDRRHHQRHHQLHPVSEMRDKGLDFDVVLKEAQRLGYAEADPTFDIEGVDAAHKATLMSAIAFGIPVQFDKAYVEGITKLGAQDIRYAEQLGYRIKLLGITKRTAKGIELRVHPSLVPAKRLIANVEGAMNAVVVQGDAVGTTLYYGKGAGSEPTASAVIADLVDITRLHTADAAAPRAAPGLPAAVHERHAGAAHERGGHQLLPAPERGRRGRRAGQGDRHPGRSRHQHRRGAAARGRRGGRRRLDPDRPDHPDARLCAKATMNDALAQMQALPTVLAPIMRIRKEELA